MEYPIASDSISHFKIIGFNKYVWKDHPDIFQMITKDKEDNEMYYWFYKEEALGIIKELEELIK